MAIAPWSPICLVSDVEYVLFFFEAAGQQSLAPAANPSTMYRYDRPTAKPGHMDYHPQKDRGSARYDARYDANWVEAGGVKQLLFYCPWSSDKLPSSQRDRWYGEFKAAAIDVRHQTVRRLFSPGSGADVRPQ